MKKKNSIQNFLTANMSFEGINGKSSGGTTASIGSDNTSNGIGSIFAENIVIYSRTNKLFKRKEFEERVYNHTSTEQNDSAQ